MSDISQFIVAANKLKKKTAVMHKACEKFLDRFYCNNYMSTICQTMLGLFSINLG